MRTAFSVDLSVTSSVYLSEKQVLDFWMREIENARYHKKQPLRAELSMHELYISSHLIHYSVSY